MFGGRVPETRRRLRTLVVSCRDARPPTRRAYAVASCARVKPTNPRNRAGTGYGRNHTGDQTGTHLFALRICDELRPDDVPRDVRGVVLVRHEIGLRSRRPKGQEQHTPRRRGHRTRHRPPEVLLPLVGAPLGMTTAETCDFERAFRRVAVDEVVRFGCPRVDTQKIRFAAC